MESVAVARWIALSTLRRPVAWAAAAACLGAWALARALGPGGGTEVGAETLYDVAFLAALAGAVLALGSLGECAWILARAATPRRLGARAARRLAGAGGAASLALLVPYSLALSGAPLAAGVPLGAPLALGVLGAGAHLALVGALLLNAPLSTPSRLLALPALTWLLPALLDGEGAWWGRLARLLDASRHLEVAAAGGRGWSDGVLAVAALALIAWSLSVRPAATRKSP
ncbi:MAG: hypothetical protein QF860_07485 [Planctomycetota bacterium]|nr:hypothetical protein [Planctomycetota bacterium]